MSVIDSAAAWLIASRLSALVLGSPWIWASLETLHFFGLAVLIGTTGLLDLRLLGFFRGLPVGPLRGLFPWMMGAFALNLVTGALFVIASPLQYVHNFAFGLKLLFVGVAGLNALVFSVFSATATHAVDAGGDTPPLAKACGAVSLVAWFAVVYFGRMLPYIGTSY